MVLGVLFSSASIYCNYNIGECTTSINEHMYAAIGQYIMAIDARLAGQTEEYNVYISHAETKLKTYGELNNARQFWVGWGYFFLMGTFLSNSVAFVLALGKGRVEE
jgi:hypothetical protein